MTYNCEYSTASIDERLTRLKRLDQTTCGLASIVGVSTPTMESIADWEVEPRSLEHGVLTNQQLVMPYYQAYREARNGIHSRLGSGPVETLRYGIPKDSSDWNEVIFVSEKQVIETPCHWYPHKGIWHKIDCELHSINESRLGKEEGPGDYSKEEVIRCKRWLRSPGALGEELEGQYQGFVPEGKFISACNHVRSHVKGFAERLNNLWKNISDPVSQCFIPRKSPMIFRWPATMHGIQESGLPND